MFRPDGHSRVFDPQMSPVRHGVSSTCSCQIHEDLLDFSLGSRALFQGITSRNHADFNLLAYQTTQHALGLANGLIEGRSSQDELFPFD